MIMSQRAKSGFTMIELLVVIAIMAILMAIIVPIGKRLRENNTTSRCEAQLAHVGQALKAYFIDEGGVPPVGVEGTLNGSDEPVPTGTAIDLQMWPGLQTLFAMEYLRNRATLHCPRHQFDTHGDPITSSSPEYYQSYTQRDEKVKPTDSPLKQYKYMPYRWTLQADDPNNYLRQLTRNLKQESIAGTDYLVTTTSGAMPPDDTIITWCNQHADTYSINGHGQYVVLFWDGSVKLLDQELFQDTTAGPDEAWKVRPTDVAH